MPVIISEQLPAAQILRSENILVYNSTEPLDPQRQVYQILIVNLMPTKVETEIQLLRLLGHSPFLIRPVFIHPATHLSKNISQKHLLQFYTNLSEVKGQYFDGMIITGAPVEHLEFDEVDYWDELMEIMDFSLTHSKSTLHICWGAQAGLYYHHGISKCPLAKKVSGVFVHTVTQQKVPLLKGFDDEFYAPHSRYTKILSGDIEKVADLEVLSVSETAGIYIVGSKDGSQIFVTGHCEYDPQTLKKEYERDCSKGLDIEIPHNYFQDDNPDRLPVVRWRGHAHLLFLNWLSYYVC